MLPKERGAESVPERQTELFDTEIQGNVPRSILRRQSKTFECFGNGQAGMIHHEQERALGNQYRIGEDRIAIRSVEKIAITH